MIFDLCAQLRLQHMLPDAMLIKCTPFSVRNQAEHANNVALGSVGVVGVVRV